MSSTSRSDIAWARHNSVHPSSFSKSLSANVEYLSRSTSPSSRKDLHAEHWPSLQPCISISPCRNAPRRTVSSSSTSNSMPTGSSRTWKVCPMYLGRRSGDQKRRPAPSDRSPPWHSDQLGGRLVTRRTTRGPALLVLRHVGLALLR